MSRLLLLLLLGVRLCTAAGDDFLLWDLKHARAIVMDHRVKGKAGGNWDLRVMNTDRSYNYKLRATWFSPEVIRACSRIQQLTNSLSDEQTRRLVAEAEAAGDTIMLVEIDPREGSGVIPSDWLATLSPRGGPAAHTSVTGISRPSLSKLAPFKGCVRRDYAYDEFWVVFHLRTEDGDSLFTLEDREAQLTVRIYDKAGKVVWPIPTSIRARFGSSK